MMPILTPALIATWNDIDQHVAGVVVGDPDHAWCLDLEVRVRELYRRLRDPAQPRTDRDAALLRRLLDEADALAWSADHSTVQSLVA
jgi:hypothetical protein